MGLNEVTRKTSIKAFYTAINSGLIETRRQQAYMALRHLGEATANEVFEYMKEQQHLALRYDSNTRARFTELRDFGLIKETGERPCSVTGQDCITWRVVLDEEYVGPAVIHRCPVCDNIVARSYP